MPANKPATVIDGPRIRASEPTASDKSANERSSESDSSHKASCWPSMREWPTSSVTLESSGAVVAAVTGWLLLVHETGEIDVLHGGLEIAVEPWEARQNRFVLYNDPTLVAV